MATAHSSLEHAEVRLVDATKDESSRLAPPGPERALIKHDLMHTWLGDDALPLRGVEVDAQARAPCTGLSVNFMS